MACYIFYNFAVYTGNSWLDRKKFVKHPNKFYPLEIDYGQVCGVYFAKHCPPMERDVQQYVLRYFQG